MVHSPRAVRNPVVYGRDQLLALWNTGVWPEEMVKVKRKWWGGAMPEWSAATGREFIDQLFRPSLWKMKELSL